MTTLAAIAILLALLGTIGILGDVLVDSRVFQGAVLAIVGAYVGIKFIALAAAAG